MAKKKKSTQKVTRRAAARKTAKKVPKKTAKKLATKKSAVKKATKKVASKKVAKKNVGVKAPAKTAVAASMIGKSIEDFSLPSTSGGSVSLSGLKGKKVVLYFYPKDATPGCTIEGHEFSKLLPEFEKAGAVVYGVSRDDMDSHNKFKQKECYTVDLLSDVDETACRLFDVIKEKNMYGKKMMGIERSTFVIDSQGKVAAEWRKVSVDGHAQEVLEKVKAIS